MKNTKLYLYFSGNTVILEMANQEVLDGWRERLKEVAEQIKIGQGKEVVSGDKGVFFFTPYTFLGWRFTEIDSAAEQLLEMMRQQARKDQEGEEWKE